MDKKYSNKINKRDAIMCPFFYALFFNRFTVDIYIKSKIL